MFYLHIAKGCKRNLQLCHQVALSSEMEAAQRQDIPLQGNHSQQDGTEHTTLTLNKKNVFETLRDKRNRKRELQNRS